MVSMHVSRSEMDRGLGTLSAVLYRSIPICFSISVRNNAVSDCWDVDRICDSNSSLDWGSDDDDDDDDDGEAPIPIRERKLLT